MGRPYRVEQEVSAPFSVSTSLTCGQDIKNKINKVLLLVVFNAVTRLAAVDDALVYRQPTSVASLNRRRATVKVSP